MNTAYKLLTLRRDGTLGPLFIDRHRAIPVGEWLESECVPTEGFQVNRGWHMCAKAEAPHLVLEPKGKPPRVWCKVEYKGWHKRRNRPAAQGGDWILAEHMRIIEVLHGFEGVTKHG